VQAPLLGVSHGGNSRVQRAEALLCEMGSNSAWTVP